MEKLKDAKDVRWTESYTDRTEYLKTQFEGVIGNGIYRRWEGKEVGGPGHWYVVVSPADVHEHKRAKFFAGVRKLPDSYPAGGKYFDTIKEAYQYAHDTWGVPVPKNIPPYTAGDLRGISKKIDKWDSEHKEANSDFDINFIKTAMAAGAIKKNPIHFNIDFFSDIIERNLSAISAKVDTPQLRQELAQKIAETYDDTKLFVSTICEFFTEHYKIPVRPQDFKKRVLSGLFASFHTNHSEANLANTVHWIYYALFRDFSPINHPSFSENFYRDLLKEAGYLKGDSPEHMTEAEKAIEAVLGERRRRASTAKDTPDYQDKDNVVFSSAETDFDENSPESTRKYMSEMIYFSRQKRAKELADVLTSTGSFSSVGSLTGYSAISRRSNLEDGIFSTYNVHKKNKMHLQKNYDFSRFIYHMRKLQNTMTYEDFIEKCEQDPQYANEMGLVKNISGKWSLRPDKLPVAARVTFGRNDSSVVSNLVYPYNAKRRWDSRINFSKFSLNEYKDDRGYSALELAFLSTWGLDVVIPDVPENQEFIKEQKEKIDRKLHGKFKIPTVGADPVGGESAKSSLSECIDKIKEYLLTTEDIDRNKNYRLRDLGKIFDAIEKILISSGVKEADCKDYVDPGTKRRYPGIISQLKSAFSGWIIFKCSGDGSGSAVKLKNWRQELEGRRYGAWYGGKRAVHDNLSKKSVVGAFQHAADLNIDTVSVDAERLADSISHLKEYDELKPEDQNKVIEFVKHIKSFPTIDVKTFKKLVAEHGLTLILGERQVRNLFSKASAAAYSLEHKEGITKPSKRGVSLVATLLKTQIKNNLASIQKRREKGGVITPEELSYEQAMKNYIDNEGIEKVNKALARYTGSRIPKVRLQSLLNSQYGIDDNNQVVYVLNPPHMSSGAQEDTLLNNAGISGSQSDSISQYSSVIEPSDYAIIEKTNSYGVDCAAVSFRDYFYYKTVKTRLERTWKLRRLDPMLYEQILRAHFIPDGLDQKVSLITGNDTESNIEQIESLIKEYFEDQTPAGPTFPGLSLGELRKTLYGSYQMFNKSAADTSSVDSTARYVNMFSKGGKLDSFRFRLLQKDMLWCFARDLVTKKTITGEDGKAVETDEYIAYLSEDESIRNSDEYKAFLQELYAVVKPVSSEEQKKTRMEVERKKQIAKNKMERDVRDLKKMTPDPIELDNKIKAVKKSYAQELKDLDDLLAQEGKKDVLESATKLIDVFVKQHAIPVNFSESAMRTKDIEDSNRATSSELSQTASMGHIVLLGGKDITKTECILTNLVNFAIVANPSFSDYKGIQSRNDEENPNWITEGDSGSQSIFDSLNSHQLSIAHLTGGVDWDSMGSEKRDAHLEGHRHIFGMQHSEGGYALYARLISALTNAVQNRKGKPSHRYDIFIKKESGKVEPSPWFDAFNTDLYPGNMSVEICANYVANWILTRNVADTKDKMTEEILAQILGDETKARQLFKKIGFKNTVTVNTDTSNDANTMAAQSTNSMSAKEEEKEDEENPQEASQNANAEASESSAEKDADALTEVQEGEKADEAAGTGPAGSTVTPTEGQKAAEGEGTTSAAPETPATEETPAEATPGQIAPAPEETSPTPAATPAAQEPQVQENLSPVAPSEIPAVTSPTAGPTITHVPKPSAPAAVKPTMKPKATPSPMPGMMKAPKPVAQPSGGASVKKKGPSTSLIPGLNAPKPAAKKASSFTFEKVAGEDCESNESLVHLLRIASLYNKKGLFDKAEKINEYVKQAMSKKSAGFNKQAITKSMEDLLVISCDLQKEGKIDEAAEINMLVKKYLKVIQPAE
jgi:hypothetical protein